MTWYLNLPKLFYHFKVNCLKIFFYNESKLTEAVSECLAEAFLTFYLEAVTYLQVRVYNSIQNCYCSVMTKVL